MILAAGLGTRLRPLTNDRPKALVEIGGKTMLEITLSRLRKFGVDEAIINVHYFADMIEDYLKAHDYFGMRIEISHEQDLLDTGGGLKKAAYFFLEPGRYRHTPFILHNVDVLSDADIESMVQIHLTHRALATLAVQNRESSRSLLFDQQSLLCGRKITSEQVTELIPGAEPACALAFSGIHVICPRLLEMLDEAETFSIINAYLRLAAKGERILAFRADKYYWRDLGKPESISRAEEDVRCGAVSL
jgi:NDP-sugar pyrophosphorylase family protein